MSVFRSRFRTAYNMLSSRGIFNRATPFSFDQEPAPQIDIPPLGPEHFVSEDKQHEIIDILNPKPAVVLDRERVDSALEFGFIGGSTTGVLTEALSRAPIAASDWDPTCFEDTLFVSELINTSMKVTLDDFEPVVDKRFLTRLITRPPSDLGVVVFRREILQELALNSELRSHFNQTYCDLYRLRELFDSTKQLSDIDDRTRRLDILTIFKDVISKMQSSFSHCKSGLLRINRFAESAHSTTGYQKMCELLEYESHLSSVDIKLSIGADGRIRHFDVIRVSENRKNSFYQTPLWRFWLRFVFFIRGYGDAMSEAELVNRWIYSVFDGIQNLFTPLIQLIGEMEFYLSALAFRDSAQSRGLEVSFLDFSKETENNTGRRILRGLFNPLLYAQGITPVSCTIEIESEEGITIVTGPNSGGKTRLLQAIGIAQMLGQCGMYAPVREGSLARVSGLFVSLIAEARADQREGRLGTELIRIRQLFERACYGSLIILDELCSGTNPSEGEEIFKLVISLLKELRPCVFITTHFLQFASRLQDEPNITKGLCFLRVKLDENNYPTYNFVPGVAKTSLADQTAARLGVTRDELLTLIRRNCSD